MPGFFDRFRRGQDLHDIGTDPDVRYTYANERTFLAWSRTSLALVVTGIAATQLLPKFDIEFGRRLIGIPLIVLGAVLEIASYREWVANERAMRLGESLPATRMAVVLTIGIVIVAIFATAVAIIG
jgi:putative membrane protein